jgi:hypothetical protein
MKYIFWINPWAEEPVKVESNSLEWIRAIWDALARAGIENLSQRP